MKLHSIVLAILLALPMMTFAQDENSAPREFTPLFVKATFFPTFSLSRYDYNLDLNRRELRAYIEIREKDIRGKVVTDAGVWVNKEAVAFNPKRQDYRKRILLPHHDSFPREILLKIHRGETNMIRQKVVFPGWVKITSPQPQILASGNGLEIHWAFTANPFPLVLNIEDFKQRRKLHRRFQEPGDRVILDPGEIPEGTILRIWIATDWFFKKYLSGKYVVRGSEINIMPWSQVFLRTAPVKSKSQ